MQMLTSSWNGYALIDSGNGKRLERFGDYTLARPDPQALWLAHLPQETWNNADAVFDETTGKGKWSIRTKIPEKWLMQWEDISFYAKLTPFKHTGVFPEQSVNWEWLQQQIANSKWHIENNKKPNILNLFAYTGIASLVCAGAGAQVTHVDASKPTIGWARENQAASELEAKPIRWILDDAVKFVEREIKRGVRYDGIIMDPPVYGHGPDGQPWDFTKDFPRLMEVCKQVLSDQPLFVLVNAYAVSASAIMLENVLTDYLKPLNGIVESGELALKEENSERLLSTGIFGRWSSV